VQPGGDAQGGAGPAVGLAGEQRGQSAVQLGGVPGAVHRAGVVEVVDQAFSRAADWFYA
jgi:hypothetical protein